MSNIDNITQKILADARAQADEIANESKRVVDELLAESDVRAEAQSQHIIEKATEEAARKKAKILSNARIKARDEALGAKQVVLSRVFDLAQEKLAKLDDSAFGDFLTKTIASLCFCVIPRSLRSCAISFPVFLQSIVKPPYDL